MKRKITITLLGAVLLIATIAYAQNSTSSGAKFEYCQMFFQREYVYSDKPVKMWVDYSSRSENLSGTAMEGLSKLGGQGWELASFALNSFDNGYEYIYVLKRKK